MNVVDILDEYSIKYRETGKDYIIQCLNPEHEDHNPSLNIDKVTGIFHCFSCGFKGNIYTHFGAEPNYINQHIATLQDKIQTMLSKKYLTMPSDTVPFYKDYRGISKDTYAEVNAFLTDEIDDLKDRLCFPIYDIRGNLRIFCGRALHSEEVKSKYIFYPAHTTPPLFPAMPEIWKNSVILVEGIFDALNLRDKGCYNVICAFGTTSLHKNYKDRLAHLKIMGVNKFYIMFDGDESGIREATKLEERMISGGFNAERIELPEGLDPGDLTQEQVKYLMTGLYGNESSSS